MSASREKKTRQDTVGESLTEKQLKQQKEEQQARTRRIGYTVLGVVLAVLTAALLTWNSGFFQNRAAAVTINGEKFTAADVQYYYNGALQQAMYESYAMQSYGVTSGFDYTADPRDQIYDEATGQTWHDYLLDQAVEALTQQTALYNEAKAQGHTLSADGQTRLDSALDSIQSGLISSGYTSKDAYIRANYGSTMSYNKFVDILNRAYLASDFASVQADSYTYDDSQLDAYYQEHADEMDTFTITQFVFQASVDATDGEGNPVEMTEEEQATALEEAKAEMKAKAEAVMAALQAGEDPQALAEEYEPFQNNISDVRLGSRVNTSYADWAFNSARRSGDVTLAEYESGSVYNYYVAQFEDRTLSQDPTSNVRHILVAAESDAGAAEPTDQQYADAKAKAEDLLAQWKAGEATEDSFAALVADNTADSGSASTGGLYQNLSPADTTYDPNFLDWVTDPSRQAGDTGIVQNTTSTTRGYHILYFVDWGDPVWKQSARSALQNADYTQWEETLMEGYTAQRGSGLNYVV